MTPEERRALADRMESFIAACERARSGLDTYDLHYINRSARVTLGDVRAAAAALREMDAEVARLREGIESALAEVSDHSPLSFGKDPVGCTTCYPHDASWPCGARDAADSLSALLDEGAPADAVVVIPRSAIPDGLAERLDEAADYRERTIGARSPHAADLRAAARLLSGTLTELETTDG